MVLVHSCCDAPDWYSSMVRLARAKNIPRPCPDKTNDIPTVSIKESEIWKLEQDENRIMAALKLSYYDLPHHLRQCFALCSIFPKDFEFANLFMVSFWMVQSLIQSLGQNTRIEDIGKSYINELLSRSLFQDVKQNIHD